MADQAPTTSGEAASVSPEIADYFGVGQAPKASEEKVNSDSQEIKKTVADTTKANSSEGKQGEAPKVEAKATEDKKTTDTKDPKEGGYEVAGTKYETIDKAIEAVNRINGDNSRLSGDNKTLKAKFSELEEKSSGLEKLLADYKTANEEWKKYYEEGGEKPDNTKVNLEEVITKVIEGKEKQKSEKALKEQYATELDAVFTESDFDKVQPFFKELIDEYEGTPKVSPKKLFERARIVYKNSLSNNELKDTDSIKKMVDDMVQKELAKREAAGASSASGGSSITETSKDKVSPEIADYFKSRM